MDTQFNLDVKTPCSENFNTFSPTKKGGFCSSCTQEVVDFTSMNAEGIINYFKTHSTKNTCGRFKNDQLKTYAPNIQKRRNISFISGLGLAFISLFSFSKAGAQATKSQDTALNTVPPRFQNTIIEENITVKGTIVDENGLPMPGVSILLEGTLVGTQSDFDGNFQLPKKVKKGDIIVFSAIGYNSKKVIIEDKDSSLNIALKVNLSMDSCIIMGKVAVKKVYKSKK
jgi:hypothetical protein